MDIRLLTRLLHSSTGSCFEIIERSLDQGYHKAAGCPDYQVYVPTSDLSGIALVAHVDTVPRRNGVELEQKGVYVRNKLGILGADDRAGVYALLEIARSSQKKPILIFTNGEELGGIGAKKLANDRVLDEFKDTIDLFIELDREGIDDYVYYSCDIPQPIVQWVRTYGFKQADGAYSDVVEFTRVTGIPHLNLSTGYFNRHTEKEYLDLTVLNMTIDRVLAMIEDDLVPRSLRVSDANCVSHEQKLRKAENLGKSESLRKAMSRRLNVYRQNGAGVRQAEVAVLDL